MANDVNQCSEKFRYVVAEGVGDVEYGTVLAVAGVDGAYLMLRPARVGDTGPFFVAGSAGTGFDKGKRREATNFAMAATWCLLRGVDTQGLEVRSPWLLRGEGPVVGCVAIVGPQDGDHPGAVLLKP